MFVLDAMNMNDSCEQLKTKFLMEESYYDDIFVCNNVHNLHLHTRVVNYAPSCKFFSVHNITRNGEVESW